MADDSRAVDGVVVDVLSGCRERGIRGASVLQLLGAALCYWGEGLGLSELRGRLAVGPRLDEKLREWTKCALASLASLTGNAEAQVPSSAAWAWARSGSTRASLA